MVQGECMPVDMETRKVSLFKWYDPRTWGKFIEEKAFYFSFNTLGEMNEFLSGEFNERILREGIDMKENDSCQQ